MVPDEDQAMVLPCASVMVIIVLLKEALTCATPEVMFLRSRRRGLARPAAGCCSLAIRFALLEGSAGRRRVGGLGGRFLLAGDRPCLALARARVGVCPLTSDRQAAAMPQAAVAAKVHQPFDIHGNVSPQVALHDVVAVDRLADLQDLRVGQLVDPTLFGNARLLAHFSGKLRSNAVNVLKRNHHALLRWNVDACDASHVSLPETAACHCRHRPPWRCLTKALITRTNRPRRHCSP